MADSGATWEAENSERFSALLEEPSGGGLFGLSITEDERESLLSEADELERRSGKFQANAPPPAAIDWRDVNGQNWVTPVRNQENCGACVSFATCASMEARLQIQAGALDDDLDLSEADLFFCGCGACCGPGWNFPPALAAAGNGVGLERDFPYPAKNVPCTAINPVARIDSWDAEISHIGRRQAIANGGPVIAGMRVFEDFYFYKGGVYTHVTGDERGLHAICVVGYDDLNGFWICKNSWGQGWGESGFFKVGYGECGLDSEFPFYDPDAVAIATTGP